LGPFRAGPRAARPRCATPLARAGSSESRVRPRPPLPGRAGRASLRLGDAIRAFLFFGPPGRNSCPPKCPDTITQCAWRGRKPTGPADGPKISSPLGPRGQSLGPPGLLRQTGEGDEFSLKACRRRVPTGPGPRRPRGTGALARGQLRRAPRSRRRSPPPGGRPPGEGLRRPDPQDRLPRPPLRRRTWERAARPRPPRHPLRPWRGSPRRRSPRLCRHCDEEVPSGAPAGEARPRSW